MPVIIGNSTYVGGFVDGECVTSVNWNYNPNTQRIYCLGDWHPDDNRTIKKPTYTASVTLYSSGTTPTYDVSPDEDCGTTNQLRLYIQPGGGSCWPPGDAVESIDYSDWVATSYSYSKDDPQNPGNESWSLQRWDADPGATPNPIIAPTYLIRGITEGSVSEEVQAEAGIVFDPATATDQGSQGSVSANAIGRADTTINGVIITVGGSTSVYGHIGQGSASMPYTPLWL